MLVFDIDPVVSSPQQQEIFGQGVTRYIADRVPRRQGGRCIGLMEDMLSRQCIRAALTILPAARVEKRKQATGKRPDEHGFSLLSFTILTHNHTHTYEYTNSHSLYLNPGILWKLDVVGRYPYMDTIVIHY